MIAKKNDFFQKARLLTNMHSYFVTFIIDLSSIVSFSHFNINVMLQLNC